MRAQLVSAVKIAIAAAILGFLVYKNQDPIQELWVRDKNLSRLAASFLTMLLAVCLSFVRWYLLVRALQIPFTLREAFRYGFIGYLFNFVGPSSVGGDLAKAFLLVRNQTERRAEAVATILLDRFVGLYSLMLVATLAIGVAGAAELEQLGPFLQLVGGTTLVATVGGLLLLLPAMYSDWLVSPLKRTPWIGDVVHRVTDALDLYRQRRSMLLLAILVSCITHACIALAVRFADTAIHPVTPTMFEHLIIWPLASVAAAAPLPGGMGTFELAMSYLFEHLPSLPVEPGQGLSVAVIYRLVTVGVAMVGVVYYFANKADVNLATEQAARST